MLRPTVCLNQDDVETETQDKPIQDAMATKAIPDTRKALIVILVLGAIVRLALWLCTHNLPLSIVDEQHYDGLATRLLLDHAYTDPGGQLTSMRPPLYPVFVANVYAVFGLQNFAAVRAIQAVLTLAITLIIYLIGKEVYSQRVGVWAAACFCFYPSFLGFGCLLVSEVVFTLFVVMLLYFTIRGIKNQSLLMVLLSGIVLGLGALTRSVLWLYLPFHVLMLFAFWPGKWRSKTTAALIMMVTVCLILAPWSYRNTVLQRTFVVVDVMGGRNVMMGNYDYTPLDGSWITIAKTRGEKSWAKVMLKDTPGFSQMTAGQKSDAALDYAKRYVLAHPVQTIQRDVVKFFNFWQLERTIVAGAQYGVFGELPVAMILVIAALVFTSYAALIFAAIFGVWCAPPKDKRMHIFFLVFGAIPCAVHTLIFAHSRYHLPLIPILVIYAVSACLTWSTIWQQRRSWRFLVAGLMCLILIGGWAREIVMYDLHRSGWLDAVVAYFG